MTCAAAGALVALGATAWLWAGDWRAEVEADWLRQEAKRLAPVPVANVTPQEDAAGGVDGVKDGKWGFHTGSEAGPWWQVDLGQQVKIGRVVIYNRCDAFADRNSRLKVLVSDDGVRFRQAYQHDGKPFFGCSDGKPLVVSFDGVEARHLRLQIDGPDYFHLDEIEVYPANGEGNVALGKPAAQSSVSAWSARHSPPGAPAVRDFPVERVVASGLKLAASLRRLGLDVNRELAGLEQISRDGPQAGDETAGEVRRACYLRARWLVREMAMRNPLLNFDKILFVKRAPTMFPHMSDQHYGWWSRPGGGVCVLEDFKSGAPKVRCLTEGMPVGSFQGPDLSFDGKRVLFAACRFHPGLADERDKANKARVPESAFYHIHEIGIDGTGHRQITRGKYDDFDPRHLPSGDIVFVSTRKGTAIQCSQWFSDSTRGNDHADSYVRCGGDNYRPVPVFTLHAMSPAGEGIRPLSAFENFEWTPSVANDGLILYTRWDYIDRFNGHFFSLWSANQDGGNPQLVYGNYTVKPQVKFEARAIPGSGKIVFTAGAHHSISGGTLCLLDRARGTEGEDPLTRLTPEVRFPETEANDEHYFSGPWPLSEEFFLVSWADSKLPPHGRFEDGQNPVNASGIYLLDTFGNLELLHRDPGLSSVSPIPVVARPRPPVQPAIADWSGGGEGRMLVQDVSRGLEGVSRGTIKRLRLVAVPPKVQPQMNNPVLGVSNEDPGKYVLGTVPVEEDGSAYFRVPAGVPVFFQALDAGGVAVQTMRTLTYVMPGQTLSCVGCHEGRESAPPAGQPPLAAVRPASRITPGPEGSWPLRFDQLVQPVLDRHCVECHRPEARGAKASRLDLTAARAYDSLLGFGDGDLRKQAFERDRSLANEGVTATSKLWALLTRGEGHESVALDAGSLERLTTWMDTYAHRQGHYSPEQEQQLIALRRALLPLLEER